MVVNFDVRQTAGPSIIYLPMEFDQPYVLFDHITEERYERNTKELTVVLPPGESHIFEVRI